MKRKLLCAVLALILLFAVGCGSSAASSSAATSGAGSSAASSGASSSGEAGSLEYELPNYSLGLLDNGYFEGVTALEHVTLPEKLTGISIPADVQTVADEDIQKQIDAILESYASDGMIYDRAVESGDLVNIDYVGRIDGVEFSGGSTGGAGTTVTAGGSGYIDDFLTQIIGAKPGDTVMVEVTFPDPYPNNTDLSGKDAVFETVINYIQGESVIPELTEALIEEHIKDDYGYTSVEDMKQEIHDVLKYDQMRTHVLEWLEASCAFGEVPEQIIANQNELLRVDISNTAYYYGMDLATLLSYYGWSSIEDAYAYYRDDYTTYSQQYLMCQAVAETLKIEIEEDDIADYFTNVVGNPEYDAFVTYYGQGYISQDVLVHQVTQYLIDNAILE